jgi:predicted enzyme related to lactoylglutathione lyase
MADTRHEPRNAPESSGDLLTSPPSHVPTRGLYGWITHTDFASADPLATKEWCAKVLGWVFQPSVPVLGGEYHLFAYSDKGGGGIRPAGRAERPGSVPFVHVEDARVAFATAVREGAEPISPPARVREGVTIAIVRAPGGVAIGFSGP